MTATLIISTFSLIATCLISIMMARQWRDMKQHAKALEAYHQQIDSLEHELRTLMSCSQGVGASLNKQQKQIRNLLQRQDKLEQLDTGQTYYTQAITMLKRGADNDEITQSCGLSSGELDLIRRLNP